MILNSEKLCVAIDTDDVKEAHELIDLLRGHAGYFKIGKQLFTKLGPEIIRYVLERESKVFLDLKFHDIPNTVRGAAMAAANHEVDMITVHASGGLTMMRAAMEGVKKSKHPSTLVIAVTLLTSLDERNLNDELLVATSTQKYVEHLSRLAHDAHVDGVVASPQEIEIIRKACGKSYKIITPGVRPDWAADGDQRRVMTPKEAITKGADLLVIGRPITAASDRLEAVEKILMEISN